MSSRPLLPYIRSVRIDDLINHACYVTLSMSIPIIVTIRARSAQRSSPEYCFAERHTPTEAMKLYGMDRAYPARKADIGRSAMIRKRKSAVDAILMIRPPRTAQFQNAFGSGNSPRQRRHKLVIEPKN